VYPLLALVSLVGAALYLESVDPTKGARGKTPADGTMACKGPKETLLLRTLAAKWCEKFSGVPIEWVMAIGQVESGHRPTCSNLTGGDLLRGGAWGFMQQTYATALGNIRTLKTSTDADVQATLARAWHGIPTNLQDPDLNVMIAVYHLSVLSRRYSGDFAKAAGAYNRGTGGMDKLIKAGTDPNTLAYVQKASMAKGSA